MAEPMGDKPVTELAGVGDVLGQRLEDAGFDKVRLGSGEGVIRAYTVLPRVDNEPLASFRY